MNILKLKKADEMEMAINFKAMRLAYVFVLAALLIWMNVEFISTKELPIIQLLIILAQNSIFFVSKLLITRRMTGGSNEK